ncbi:hypothetical protein Fmac_024400 [Flemingia macrophylla]|uniref:rRNA adenine N(6)-methyltransferase n=1 Tax=Flemingia macrophylla TaxID=520843 RepID=A0ABD1LPA5_9FABA
MRSPTGPEASQAQAFIFLVRDQRLGTNVGSAQGPTATRPEASQAQTFTFLVRDLRLLVNVGSAQGPTGLGCVGSSIPITKSVWEWEKRALMAGGKVEKVKGSPKHEARALPGRNILPKVKGSTHSEEPLLVDSIMQKAGIKTTDVIVEIGPGTGNLTKKLLEADKMVEKLLVQWENALDIYLNLLVIEQILR